ncbi:hypothetical protein L2U69_11990 [Zavarzinia compransoris]|uniref:hypothetical protein n=1 Tax=Zavarzinia marina TaxID=2911065 RepID=UPI001F247BA4|nr:hypothetical protein [Zavarzinia marina]MCF4166367.1 hypothetical protein [Zavarzinia marina]
MLTVSDLASVYWRSCQDMRHGNDAKRPLAAANIIGLAHGKGPVAERARAASGEAAGILNNSDAA